MIKVSVIIPVYNTGKYLERCIKSIINQSLTDIEIIVINDGSTDNSEQILKNFACKDSRIKIINQKNAGLSITRNNGLKIANGEYISFIDSDDWVDLDFLEKLYNTAKKYDADIAACGIKRLRSYKWKYHLKIEQEEITDNKDKKFVLCDVPEKCYVWNKIYKFSELKKHNIKFEEGVYYEDRCFTAQALVFMKKLVVVPDTYYNYWTNSNSIVKTKSPKKESDSKYTKDKMMKFLEEQNVNLNHHYSHIKKFKIFGLTLMKIKYYSSKKEYIIFNQIKFSFPLYKHS